MDRGLLNANQQRRVATHLRLLAEDCADLAGWPELQRPGEPYASLRALIGRLAEAVAALGRSLDLPAHQAPPLRRRVMATAEVWASSMEDVKSRHLKAYGRVHPELGRELDPRVDEIVAMLREVADLADRLPDR
ncbi:MAG TPA: hypothetical protein VMF70_15210 [Gemmatimonadales bacterium]|nr:hypothetical protein [Gemmatimonadales bacterium]